ncbi:MAG: acyl-CoA thioesterase [Paraperlucidibaca sp.]
MPSNHEYHPMPRGVLCLQTIAMPADANPNGDIFGGWLVSQMDLAAGVAARKRAKGRTVTVAIDAMVFLRPVKVGDIVGFYTEVLSTGRSSIKILVEVWAVSDLTGAHTKLTEGLFTFVAINDQGHTRELSTH